MRISRVKKNQFFLKLFLLSAMSLRVGFAQAPTPTTAAPTTTPVTTTQARIYVPIGTPNFKRVNLGIERTKGNATLARSFHQTLVSNMLYSDLFNLTEEAKMPASSGTFQIGSFSWNPYRALGLAYFIKSSIDIKDGVVEAELRLYDVNKGQQVMGKRYPFKSQSNQAARELANFSSNELMLALTGEDGIFRTRLLASCGGKKKEIFIMDFDGVNARQITRDGNFALSPSWSPDGKKVVFTSYTPEKRGGFVNPNLYIYNVETDKRELLTGAKGINSGAVFHPTKNQIAYTFSNNGKPEIFMLDLNTKTRVPLTDTMFFSIEPAWSPDGSRIVYSSSRTGKPHLYVANADGSGSRQLTFAGVYNSSPRWSPKGDRIVFSGQENNLNNFNIFMIDPSGSNLSRLTEGSKSSENPSFSPDGRHLAFSSNREGLYQIYVMALHSGKISRPLTPKSLGDCKQPAWSPRM
jgi:TolB protein